MNKENKKKHVCNLGCIKVIETSKKLGGIEVKVIYAIIECRNGCGRIFIKELGGEEK